MAAVNAWNLVVTFLITGSLVASETCETTSSKCVCYDDVGCFSTDAPYNNAHSRLPNSPSDINAQAQLFSRQNWNASYFIDFVNKTTLEESIFNPKLSTKIITHGFANDITTEWLYQMKDELLKKGDFNVFIITWGPGATFPDYDRAVANTRVVTRLVKLLIANLVDTGLDPDMLHLIGHSLGAHISGVAGSMLRTDNVSIGRITGLDPAEPDFLNYRDSVRLSKDDAKFVDVIHTDGQPFKITTGYGIFLQSGHVDFYINGGERQPDCTNPLSGIFGLFSAGTDALTTAFGCSHSRSHEVFLESINSMCSFTAYPCESYEKFQAGECLSCGDQGCTRMGYPADLYNARGKFYLNTRLSSPYCGHHYRVSVHLDGNTKSTVGQIMVQFDGTWGTSEWLTVTSSTTDHLEAGATVTRVVVAEQTVGFVQNMKIRFTSGSGGQNNVVLDKVEVEAGESGLEYMFCVKRELQSNKVMEIRSDTTKSCP